MSTETAKIDTKTCALRTVQGPVCATCGDPTGLLQLNGKTVQVESRMAQLGNTLTFLVHQCERVLEPKPKPRRFGR